MFPDGDITGQNGRGLVFRTGTLQARTAEPWCSRTGTLQDKTAEAWCSERGHYRPERPNPGVPGRGHYGTKRPRPGVPGRGHYRPRFPARLPTGWPRWLWILLSNTPPIMWRCSGSPVLFFTVLAFVVCRRRRVISLRGAVYDGRIGQAFKRPSRSGAHHVVARSKRTRTRRSRRAQTLTPLLRTERSNTPCYLANTPNPRRTPS